MRKIRDMLRLRAGGMSKRKIAASLSIGRDGGRRDAFGEPAGRLELAAAGGLSDEALEQRLYPPPKATVGDQRPRPDWAAVHRELRRPGVTLQLLWEEHRARISPTDMAIAGSASFTAHGRADCRRPCGSCMSPASGCSWTTRARRWTVMDGTTGEVRDCQLFVAVLGASNYTYAEATCRRGWPTGSARTRGPSRSSAASRRKSSPTT